MRTRVIDAVARGRRRRDGRSPRRVLLAVALLAVALRRLRARVVVARGRSRTIAAGLGRVRGRAIAAAALGAIRTCASTGRFRPCLAISRRHGSHRAIGRLSIRIACAFLRRLITATGLAALSRRLASRTWMLRFTALSRRHGAAARITRTTTGFAPGRRGVGRTVTADRPRWHATAATTAGHWRSTHPANPASRTFPLPATCGRGFVRRRMRCTRASRRTHPRRYADHRPRRNAGRNGSAARRAGIGMFCPTRRATGNYAGPRSRTPSPIARTSYTIGSIFMPRIGAPPPPN